MTESELIVVITREIKALASNFSADDYADAVDEAIRETSFTLPTTDDFQIQWLNKRTKRALFFSLLVSNAEQFKFKQINLKDKFDNLRNLVKDLDEEYQQAIEDNPHEFAQVDPYQMFGHKADAGFSYDSFGRDTTYDDDNITIVSPSTED